MDNESGVNGPFVENRSRHKKQPDYVRDEIRKENQMTALSNTGMRETPDIPQSPPFQRMLKASPSIH